MGSVGNKPLVDAFDGQLGPRLPWTEGTKLNVLFVRDVNPHYGEKGYDTNCALCTVAGVLQTMGYDVEAMPRDTQWRGFDSIFEVDWTNTDNYLLGSSKFRFTGQPKVERSLVYDYDTRQYVDRAGQAYVRTADGKQVWIKPDTAPRGADKAASAVEEKVKSWGSGAVGVLRVKWANSNSAHTVNIMNYYGQVIAYDPQTNRRIDNIQKYLTRTVANHTTVVRLDNAKIKDSAKNVIDKMVKRRDK